MRYNLVCHGNQVLSITFEPDFASSKGVYDAKLGKVAMKKSTPQYWNWNGKELVYITPKETKPEAALRTVVIQAQKEVTELMDELIRLRDMLTVIKESRGDE